jgi:hypothetical protein
MEIAQPDEPLVIDPFVAPDASDGVAASSEPPVAPPDFGFPPELLRAIARKGQHTPYFAAHFPRPAMYRNYVARSTISSIRVRTFGFNRQHRPPAAIIGDQTDRHEFIVWIRTLPDNYTADVVKTETKLRADDHPSLILGEDTTTNYTHILHIYGPVLTKGGSGTAHIFDVYFEPSFKHFSVEIKVESPELIRQLPYVDVEKTRAGRDLFDIHFTRHDLIPDETNAPGPLQRHPYFVLREVLLRYGKARSFVEAYTQKGLALQDSRMVHREFRTHLGRALVKQTLGSIKVLTSNKQCKKMVKIWKNGKSENVYGFTCVFNYALDLLRGANALITDTTWRCVRPAYCLSILAVVQANNSYPVACCVSPSESQLGYENIYSAIEELIERRFSTLPPDELARPIGDDIPFPADSTIPFPPPPGGVLEQDAPDAPPRAFYLIDGLSDAGLPATQMAIREQLKNRKRAQEGKEMAEILEVDDGFDLNLHSDDEDEDEHHPINVSPVGPIESYNPPELTRNILQRLPLVTDMGTALSAFVKHRQLDWKLCHRHIMQAVGPKSRVGHWVYRLLHCHCEETYHTEVAKINQEIEDLGGVKKFGRNMGKLQVMLGNTIYEDDEAAKEAEAAKEDEAAKDDKKKKKKIAKPSLLADMARWARWLRPGGVPTTSNALEGFHMSLNRDTRGLGCFFTRLPVVIEHMMMRAYYRYRTCNDAWWRNTEKFFPIPEASRGKDYDAREDQARVQFYRALHTAPGQQGCSFRICPPPKLVYYFPPELKMCSTSLEPPPQWKKEKPERLMSSHAQLKEMALKLNFTGAFTKLRASLGLRIAWNISKIVGPGAWTRIGVDVFEHIYSKAVDLRIPLNDTFPLETWVTWERDCIEFARAQAPEARRTSVRTPLPIPDMTPTPEST